MGKLGQLAIHALGALLLMGAAPAQSDRFSVTPDGLTAGGTADISYSNPDLAGQTVLVEIDNGGLFEIEYDYVTITLDANGNGTATWDVPESGWTQAHFLAPEAREIRLPITTVQPVVE